jgi:hypothetical protein
VTRFGIQFVNGSVETREAHIDTSASTDPSSMSGYEVYRVKAQDTFTAVCKAIALPDPQRKLYYDWLCQSHDYGARGNVYRFPSPFSKKGRLIGTQQMLEEGRPFPVPKGKQWELITELHGVQSDVQNPDWQTAAAVRVGLMTAEWNEMLMRCSDRDAQDDGVNLVHTIMESHGQQRVSDSAAAAKLIATVDVQDHTETDEHIDQLIDANIAHLDNEHTDQLEAEFIAQLQALDRAEATIATVADTADWRNCKNPMQSPHILSLIDNNNYKDPKTGRVRPPKDYKDALGRDDRDVWILATEIEMGALNKLGVFEHDLTREEVKQRGCTVRPVPLILCYTAKWDLDTGAFIKAKARLCLQGIPAFMQRGKHFFQTRASTPDPATCRFLSAVLVGRKMHRIIFDIKNAYPTTNCEEYEKIPCLYPKGMQDLHMRGDTMLICFLIKVLYGNPSAGRRFAKARDKWATTFFNNNGWQCVRCRSDPCLMKMTSPTGDLCLVCTWTDDVECITDVATDGLFIRDAYDDHFQEGVVTADPEMLLGIQRKRSTDANGVDILDCVQPDYIETLYKTYEDDPDMPQHRLTEPATPHLHLDLGGDSIKGKQFMPPSVQEVSSVLDKGYRSVVGSLLWMGGRTGPDLCGLITMLCKVMARPSILAWKAAMQCLAFCYQNKMTLGIRYRSDGNRHPQAAYDSSNKGDIHDAKAQYGYAIHLFDGPIIWAAKKHAHVGTSSTHNEYMALYHLVRAIVWLRQLITEVGLDGELLDGPTLALGDNDQATNLCYDDVVTVGNKFYHMMYHFSKEMYEAKQIAPLRIDTKDNWADLMTKSVDGITYRRLAPILCGHSDELMPIYVNNEVRD